MRRIEILDREEGFNTKITVSDERVTIKVFGLGIETDSRYVRQSWVEFARWLDRKIPVGEYPTLRGDFDPDRRLRLRDKSRKVYLFLTYPDSKED